MHSFSKIERDLKFSSRLKLNRTKCLKMEMQKIYSILYVSEALLLIPCLLKSIEIQNLGILEVALV